MPGVPPSDDSNDLEKPSGRVRHDKGGRAVWEWAVDSGRHAIESTSRLLKRLDLSGLKLTDYEPEKNKEEEAPPSTPGADGKAVPTFGGERESDPLGQSRRSFDPYDNRVPLRQSRSSAPARPKPRLTQPARPEKKPGLLGRLFGKH